MRLLLIWLINALSLLAVAYVLPSVRVESFVVAMVAALVLGLINTSIRPLLLLVTLPLNILTLGLFTLVVNALMFWFATSFFEGFRVAGFWSAFWGAIVYSLISSVASWLLIPRPRLPPPPADYIDSTSRRL